MSPSIATTASICHDPRKRLGRGHRPERCFDPLAVFGTCFFYFFSVWQGGVHDKQLVIGQVAKHGLCKTKVLLFAKAFLFLLSSVFATKLVAA